jgi:replicative DNA helicase
MRGDTPFDAPPCTDFELEQLYIRSCLGAGSPVGAHLVDDIARLEPCDMYSASHRAMLVAIYEMADSRKRPYESDVARAIKPEHRDAFEAIIRGKELQPPAKVADELRALARRRRSHETAIRIARALEKGDMDEARELSAELAADSGNVKRADEYMQASEAIEAAVKNTARQGTDLRTGFPILDHALGQLRRATMTVIGGYEGTGKSGLMLSMAVNLAHRGIACGYVSLEDPVEVVGPRILAHFEDVNPEEFDGVRGMYFDECVKSGIDKARQIGLYCAFEEGANLNRTLGAMRTLARKYGCRVLFVDYLQCLSERSSKRADYVSEACKLIKAQAQKLGVALVLGSQLNNPEKGSEFKAPRNTSLKESGDIKDKAEVIILLWKTGDHEEADTRFKVSKLKWSKKRPRGTVNRNPRTGSVVGLSHVA